MHYGITNVATNFTDQTISDWRLRPLKAILFFVPRANPDIEPLYPQVKAWALELADDGWPQREIGLDSSGNPLFRAPNERNTGFWPDMAAMQFNLAELQQLSEAEFNSLWAAAQAGA